MCSQVAVCVPQRRPSKSCQGNKRDPKERVLFFSKDEQILSTILKEHDVVDWTASLSFAGIDNSYSPLLKDISSQRGSSFRSLCHAHLLHLTDLDSLLSTEHSEDHFRISSLNDSNVELVNKTWKFGGDEDGGRHIKKMIGNFPSCCIVDDHGQPVSWIILDDFCTMGMLHTLPAHRGKGYAKALVSCMARKLHAQGFPVYCFVEEENAVSYKLLTNLGFVEDPSYRAAWWDCNF
ncbi:glycine N-acyltransferase-like protein 3 isoform X2 [Gadus chalcogrammus]|uniref:glycine N-acyltransferase-like protein 3 isoform X2 n=1 Tax=Gadus chalcogrammus TaxID=1042646 RepID=UPI0024C4E5EE|nr:glycine N-acyltransferase-like protein 3 isoform X2 [Gadus chalcogrammus]XP_056464881.1 glycine N-acyltransferase-like protein 3 isoform X2 [Gadus chalcogrammus]